MKKIFFLLLFIPEIFFSQNLMISGEIKGLFMPTKTKVILENEFIKDSCFLDSTGVYKFNNLEIGNYNLKIKFNSIKKISDIEIINISLNNNIYIPILNTNIFIIYHIDKSFVKNRYNILFEKVKQNELIGYGKMSKSEIDEMYTQNYWWKYYKNDTLFKEILFDKGNVISENEYYSNGIIKTIINNNYVMTFYKSGKIQSVENFFDEIRTFSFYKENNKIYYEYIIRNSCVQFDYNYLQNIINENINLWTRIKK